MPALSWIREQRVELIEIVFYRRWRRTDGVSKHVECFGEAIKTERFQSHRIEFRKVQSGQYCLVALSYPFGIEEHNFTLRCCWRARESSSRALSGLLDRQQLPIYMCESNRVSISR